MRMSIWASGGDVPCVTCFDARLGGAPTTTSYPDGNTRGQAGWDLGINFTNFSDLLSKIDSESRKLQEKLNPQPFFSTFSPLHALHLPLRFVSRLAIHCHGGIGQCYINGQRNPPIDAGNVNTTFTGQFLQLATKLTSDATVLLMSCMTGQGQQGTDLLINLSKSLSGRTVIAFQTIGYAPGAPQMRPGESCTEPGMRMTDGLWGSPVKGLTDPKYMKDWGDLNALPWASEKGQFAKKALNGQLI